MSCHLFDIHSGLLTRAAFLQSLLKAFPLGADGFRQHTVLHLSIDGLLGVDTPARGTEEDQLLHSVARILRRRVHDGPWVRHGGSFEILLKDTSERAADQLARALVNDLDALKFGWDGWFVHLHAFVGGVVVSRSEDVQKALALAQFACRLAREKLAGRDRVAIMDEAEIEYWKDVL